ncbi:unnamed protein product [Notodromas monacha]|uniref:Ig-like domain-containing protein n=1 Tax=Notodromas monacha TaxID=399045 RepID=A0A7R9G811_9CRUS|nr:unnamed protein product [Notodromas monacha]CAG0912621.1 unnamed protein product [Notodromas monacha]
MQNDDDYQLIALFRSQSFRRENVAFHHSPDFPLKGGVATKSRRELEELSSPNERKSQEGEHWFSVKAQVVSWVRRSDSSILSVGNSTFIQDGRFRVIHSQDSEVWGLQISSTRLSDAGSYECQISTEPKRSWVVELKVVESSVKIIGSPDIFVQSGTSVDIKCQISDPGRADSRVQRIQAVVPTESVVFWFRDGRRILPSEDGVSPISSDRLHQDVLVQALRIQSAKRSDAGNYTCALADGSSDTVILHVLNAGKEWRRLIELSDMREVFRRETFLRRRCQSPDPSIKTSARRHQSCSSFCVTDS